MTSQCHYHKYDKFTFTNYLKSESATSLYFSGWIVRKRISSTFLCYCCTRRDTGISRQAVRCQDRTSQDSRLCQQEIRNKLTKCLRKLISILTTYIGQCMVGANKLNKFPSISMQCNVSKIQRPRQSETWDSNQNFVTENPLIGYQRPCGILQLSKNEEILEI